MKSITKYLSANPKQLSKRFPNIPKTDVIAHFLDSVGFKKIQYNKGSVVTIWKALSNEAKNGNYVYTIIETEVETENIFIFCNKGKISPNNPYFYCFSTIDGSTPTYDLADETAAITIDNKMSCLNSFYKFKDFAEYVNNFFEW